MIPLAGTKVAPIEAVGIIASIVTACAFLIVLYFQIKATRSAEKSANAAKLAADTAKQNIDRQRPHVKFDHPNEFNYRLGGWVISFPCKNVGAIPAYGVSIRLSVFDPDGNDVPVEHLDVAQDLPPGEAVTLTVKDTEDGDLETLLSQGLEGAKVQVITTYSLIPESSPTHHSTIIYEIKYQGNTGSFGIVQGAKLDRLINR